MSSKPSGSADKAQRGRFEEWNDGESGEGYDLTRYPADETVLVGEYRDERAQAAWEGWQTAFEAGRREFEAGWKRKTSAVSERHWGPDDDYLVVETQVFFEDGFRSGQPVEILIRPKLEAGDKRGAGEDGNGSKS